MLSCGCLKVLLSVGKVHVGNFHMPPEQCVRRSWVRGRHRTHRLGANPERAQTEEHLVNSVFCCFSKEKSTKCSRRLWLSEICCWKSSPANFDAAGKFFTEFPAAQNAIPAKVWAFSGKENGCWKIGLAFGNAPGFSPLRPPQPS